MSEAKQAPGAEGALSDADIRRALDVLACDVARGEQAPDDAWDDVRRLCRGRPDLRAYYRRTSAVMMMQEVLSWTKSPAQSAH